MTISGGQGQGQMHSVALGFVSGGVCELRMVVVPMEGPVGSGPSQGAVVVGSLGCVEYMVGVAEMVHIAHGGVWCSAGWMHLTKSINRLCPAQWLAAAPATFTFTHDKIPCPRESTTFCVVKSLDVILELLRGCLILADAAQG